MALGRHHTPMPAGGGIHPISSERHSGVPSNLLFYDVLRLLICLFDSSKMQLL